MRNKGHVKIGDLVTVRWTNSFNFYKAKGKIIKINDKSYITEIAEKVGKYPIGWKIKVPKASGSGWSLNNCIVEEV